MVVNNNTSHTCSVALCPVVLLPGTDRSNVYDLHIDLYSYSYNTSYVCVDDHLMHTLISEVCTYHFMTSKLM